MGIEEGRFRMSVIEWHDGLNVGIGFMDEDHVEAAALINTLAATGGAERIHALEEFISHCRDHFAREEELMGKVGFFALGCHQGEHQRVLAEFDVVLARLRGGDAQDEYFARTLPNWLMTHRNTMDFVTAQFARSAGIAG
jgi:hemerythrin